MLKNLGKNQEMEKEKNFVLFVIALTMFIVMLFWVTRYIVSNEYIFKFSIMKDIVGINYIVGFISVLCCGMYYYIYKSEEFFIYTLIFISIYLEYTVINVILVKLQGSITNFGEIMTIPYIFRLILINIIVFRESCEIEKIFKKKEIIFILNIIITTVIMLIEFYLKVTNNFFYSLLQGFTVQVILVVIYHCLLIYIGVRSIKEKSFVYIVIVISLSILNFRRLVTRDILNNNFENSILYYRAVTFLAFMVLIIALFNEIIRKVKENEVLNEQIVKNEIEVHKIMETETLRTQFFANLSHELKTPLNIINSCNQLLKLEKEKGERELYNCYSKYEKTLIQNCYRMQRLVGNLMDISKYDSGFFNMNFENQDIVVLVENLILSIVPYVEDKNRNIIFDTYVEELKIKCDREAIERVILNLISNSIKFTKEKGNIMVIMDADETWVTIKVKDDGIGIDKEFKNKIFDRFAQVDTSLSRKKEGSGIGLSIVKAIVELHGGEIYLQDNVKVGAEFIIKLPNVKSKESTKVKNIENSKVSDRILIEFSDIYD